MEKSQVKSREAKVDFDGDALEGEKTRTTNNLTRNVGFISLVLRSIVLG